MKKKGVDQQVHSIRFMIGLDGSGDRDASRLEYGCVFPVRRTTRGSAYFCGGGSTHMQNMDRGELCRGKVSIARISLWCTSACKCPARI